MNAESLSPGRLGRWLPAWVFAFALALRAAYLLTAPQTPLLDFCDATDYREAGAWIAQGKFPGEVRYRMGQQGPVYPLFLGAVFALQRDDDVWSVRWLQALIDSLTCALAACIAGRLSGARAAWLAGMLTSCHPGLILHTGVIHTETLATCVLAWATLLMVRDARLESPRRAIVSGVLLGAACLTRVTLLPAAPFVALAIGASGAADWRRRGARVGWFLLGCGVVLGSWSLLAKQVLRTRTTAGAGGVAQQIGVIRAATDPARRGWPITSGLPTDPPLREELWGAGVAQTLASLTNLVFCHLWFCDNIWREHFVVSPAAMDPFQRFVSICAVFGGCLMLARWREMRPGLVLVALFVGLVGTSAKYIEIRPALIYQPALCVLAGVFLAALRPRAAAPAGVTCRPTPRGALAPWFACGALVVFFAVTRFPVLTSMLPSLDPTDLGRASDVAAVTAFVALGAIVSVCLAQAGLGKRAWLVGGGAAALFAVGFGCYAAIGSASRWQSWRVDLARQSPAGAVQCIHFPQAIDANEVQSVWCVVDLETNDRAQLAVSVNEEEVADHVWQPMRPWSARMQHILSSLSGFTGRPLTAWPQWWQCELPAAAIAQRDQVTLRVRAQCAGQSLGGTYGKGDSRRYRGPGIVRDGWISCYRWEVLEDWRVWEKATLASLATQGQLLEPIDASSTAIADALARDQVVLGIRLVIYYKDGRRLVY